MSQHSKKSAAPTGAPVTRLPVARPLVAGPPVAGQPVADDNRRGFVTRFLAAAIGGIVGLVPMAAGIVTFFDPLRSRDKSNGSGASSAGEKHPGRKVRVATLDAVPDDGVPRQFPVIADRQDAWNYFPDEPIGMVYLRREKGSREVLAFNATCPHAGCLVGYKSDRGIFLCPCHTSSFQVDGSMIQPSPSPRAMDQVPATIEKHGGQETIWVWYQDFYTGKAKQIAKS